MRHFLFLYVLSALIICVVPIDAQAGSWSFTIGSGAWGVGYRGHHGSGYIGSGYYRGGHYGGGHGYGHHSGGGYSPYYGGGYSYGPHYGAWGPGGYMTPTLPTRRRLQYGW